MMSESSSGLFIGGEWRAASDGASRDITDPARLSIVGSYPIATAADLDEALEAAAEGFRAWRAVDAWTRSETLRRIATTVRERVADIARLVSEDMGKPIGQARAEVMAAASYFDWFADEARRIYGRVIDSQSTDVRIHTRREPIGPVAAFTPWNFPALLPARKIAPALAAGCSLILKPAEEAPRSSWLLAAICADAGIPPGTINVVTGDPAMISEHLIRSEVIRKVSLTGSIPVGRKLLHLAADGIKPVSLELGGHSPVLVFEDADPEAAAEVALRSKFRNGGQVCVSPSRFYVHPAVAEPFVERFTAGVRSLRIGDPLLEETEVGPLASIKRLDSIEGMVAEAIERGAGLASGGRRTREPGPGFFFEPTVLTGVDDSALVMTEEPFGPIAPMTSFEDLDDVLARANATAYGLAGYVFTRNLRTAYLAAEGLEVGMVGVNNLVIATAEAPFGGIKNSGFGREGGAEGIDDYTTVKYVNMRL